MSMQRFMLVGGLLVLTIAVGCSGSDGAVTRPPTLKVPTEQWSDSVLRLAPNDPTAQETIFGSVVDSSGGGDSSHETPVAGASVTLGSMMPPPAAGQARSTAIEVLGHIVADADGRFLITSAPKGYYYVGAQSQVGDLRSGATEADLRGANGATEVTIYVLHGSQQ
jgi:hypothetical protein